MLLRKIFYSSTFCLALLVSLGAAVSLAEPRKAIHIAANVPLTGDLAMYGTAIRDGATLAAEESVTDRDARPLVFDWQDNLGNNSTTSSVLKAQLTHPVDIYISGLKPQTMVITGELTRRGIPHFPWILDVKINEGTRNNLRTWVNFGAEAQAFLDYLGSKKSRRVALLYAALPAVEVEYQQIIVPALKQRGAEEVLIDGFPLDTTDFKTLALRIKQFQPDVIILNGFVNHLVPLVRALNIYKLIHDGNCLVSLDMLEAAPLLQPSEIEGIVVAAPYFLSGKPTESYSAWTKLFKDRFGRAPVYHSAYAYDMVKLILEATKALPAYWDSTVLLDKLRGARVQGVTGEIALDEDGSLKPDMVPSVYRGGQLVPVTPRANE